MKRSSKSLSRHLPPSYRPLTSTATARHAGDPEQPPPAFGRSVEEASGQSGNAGVETEADVDPDSLQARLVRALQEKYVTPTAAAQLPPRQPRREAGTMYSRPPPSQPQMTSQQAEDAVSQAVAESLVQAEQVGATQAAILAERGGEQRLQSQRGPAAPTEEIQPPKVGTFEEGRFLPKTPDGQPWNAKYVRPAHAGTQEGSAVPSVHYGKLLGGKGSSSSMKSTTQRLRDLGVNPASLPLDDAKAMRAVRDGIRRFEKAGRVYGAKFGASQYKVGKLTQAEAAQLEAEIEREMERSRKRKLEREEDAEGADADPAADGDVDPSSSNVTRLGRQMPESRDSSRARGGGSAMSLRRWTSVADERIEAARAAGFFKENKLRGKPLEWEVHERNPYLGKEEFLMNRIVKRQGAAPPWVELNQQFYSDLNGLRSKMVDSYSRRAVRHFTRSGLLSSSGGPGTGSSGGNHTQRREYFLSLARSYRDGEWVAQEKGYHNAAVKDLNDTLRKHNNISPPTARRGMVVREEELAKCFEDSVEFIADGLEEAWLEVTGQKVRPGESGGLVFGGNTYDIWGNPVDERASSSGGGGGGWMGLSSLFSKSSQDALSKNNAGGGGEDSEGVVSRAGGSDRDEGRHRNVGPPYLGQGLLERIKSWLGRS